MRNREFLTAKQSTMEDALAVLFSDMHTHLKDKTEWQWRKKPEIAAHKDGWRAYARIEYK